MLHVAFDELPAAAIHQVAAIEVRPAERQGHHVLELVAEPERTARLVEARPGPETCAHELIEHPAVKDQIE